MPKWLLMVLALTLLVALASPLLADEAKGKIKEDVGKLRGDKKTEISGKADQIQGKVKEGIGDLKNEVAEEKERTETPR